MQTILGSGGAIGVELAKVLPKFTNKIRLVSRNPKKVNETDELFSADLLSLKELQNAVEGSSVLYVTIGFPYKFKVWQQNWPKFINNVVDICVKNKIKLLFFDNIYMYDANFLNGMDENTPVNPCSKKGKLRAEIANTIMKQVKEKNLTALIARCADFYGPNIEKTSLLAETVIKPLIKGKKATWLGKVNFKHSFTYTLDAALATAMLGNTDEAFNQIWHLPTTENPPTGKEWIEAISKEINVEPKFMEVSKLLTRMIGLFEPTMKEITEMMYQNDRHYVFNSSKFCSQFNFTPTPYSKGIVETVKSYL